MSRVLGTLPDMTHDPVLALVRSQLDAVPAGAGHDALADVQRHPAVLVDTVLQLAELCAALAEAAADRLGRPPAEVVETYRGLLRMVADERPPLRLLGAS